MLVINNLAFNSLKSKSYQPIGGSCVCAIISLHYHFRTRKYLNEIRIALKSDIFNNFNVMHPPYIIMNVVIPAIIIICILCRPLSYVQNQPNDTRYQFLSFMLNTSFVICYSFYIYYLIFMEIPACKPS